MKRSQVTRPMIDGVTASRGNDPKAAGAGVAITQDPDDIVYALGELGRRGRTWRDVDRAAWDALDAVTGFTIRIELQVEGVDAPTWVELSDHGGGLRCWLPNHTADFPMDRYTSGLTTLPKWLWRQIGYQVMDVTGFWYRREAGEPVSAPPALIPPIDVVAGDEIAA